MTLGKKSLSRRHLLTITGGAVGAAASSNAVASVLARPARRGARVGSGKNASVADNSNLSAPLVGGHSGETRVGTDFGGPRGTEGTGETRIGTDFGGPRATDGAGELRIGNDFGGPRFFEGTGEVRIGTDFGGPRFHKDVEPIFDPPRATTQGTETGGPNYRGRQARGGIDLEGRELALPPPTGSDFNGAPLHTYAPPMPAAKGPVLRELEIPAASTPVLGLFNGLRVGSKVADCTIVAIHDIHMGAIPVILETGSGRRFQVDVLRRDAQGKGPAGVASARSFELFVANRGTGGSKTREDQGLAIRALAESLEGSAPRSLLTLRQRNSRFPRGGFAVPV